MEEYVRVSDIGSYLKCPRMVYYAGQGHEPVNAITPSYAAALMVKEMARSYADVIKSGDREAALAEVLETTALNLTAIYREELQDMDDTVFGQGVDIARSGLEDINSGIRESLERLGPKRLLDLVTIRDTEPVLYSHRFRLSGSPGGLILLDGNISPSLIRAGRPPEDGIWKDDRIRLTALSILVEEEYDCMVKLGGVIYGGRGVVREVKIKRSDRRQVLTLASRVRKIRSGRLPQRPVQSPCEYCGYTEYCQVSPTLASRFF